MKKMIAMALLMTGMVAMAQEKTQAPRGERPQMEKLTPEQRQQLMLKEMTLKLDLNASQQKDMQKIIADLDAKKEAAKAELKKRRESGEKPSADERFAMRNKLLDEQIALKAQLKKILTPEQMEKWEKIKDERRDNVKEAVRERRGKKARRG